MSALCRTCKAPVVWAKSATTNRPMILDEQPTENGNLALVEGVAHTYRAADLEAGRPRYTSHFATCPDASKWRGGGRS